MTADPRQMLDEIDARTAAATPGKWSWRRDNTQNARLVTTPLGGGDRLYVAAVSDSLRSKADADFIAHARTDVPRLSAGNRAALAWFYDRGNHDTECGWTTFGDITEECDCPLMSLYRDITSALGVEP